MKQIRFYSMYFLKTKGTGKIPDYFQVRDDSFVLVKHFKADNLEENLLRLGFSNIQEIILRLQRVEYGELTQIEAKV